jgi:hypothetical protein
VSVRLAAADTPRMPVTDGSIPNPAHADVARGVGRGRLRLRLHRCTPVAARTSDAAPAADGGHVDSPARTQMPDVALPQHRTDGSPADNACRHGLQSRQVSDHRHLKGRGVRTATIGQQWSWLSTVRRRSSSGLSGIADATPDVSEARPTAGWWGWLAGCWLFVPAPLARSSDDDDNDRGGGGARVAGGTRFFSSQTGSSHLSPTLSPRSQLPKKASGRERVGPIDPESSDIEGDRQRRDRVAALSSGW